MENEDPSLESDEFCINNEDFFQALTAPVPPSRSGKPRRCTWTMLSALYIHAGD